MVSFYCPLFEIPGNDRDAAENMAVPPCPRGGRSSQTPWAAESPDAQASSVNGVVFAYNLRAPSYIFKSPLDYFQGFPGGIAIKNPPANAGDSGSIPGPGRSSGDGNGNPLQFSHLGNPTDREALVGYSQWGRRELDMTE